MIRTAIVVAVVMLAYFIVRDASGAELPDANLTPGVAREVDLHTLCTTSTKLVRNVPESEKKAVYHNYGLQGDDRSVCKEGYEIDHLISLEIGGANDIKNLWPQSYCGENNAHAKDKCENKLHKLVCSGIITLEDAQKGISGNWVTFCGGLK